MPDISLTIADFHEEIFPPDIALGARGGPERRTDIVELVSGHEHRNSSWSQSRRRYQAGYGACDKNQLRNVIEFFEARRGRLYGFRFRDPLDYSSSSSGGQISAQDQLLGFADGEQTNFNITKSYGSPPNAWHRIISKPRRLGFRLAIDGIELAINQDYSLDDTDGHVVFAADKIPQSGSITAGFEFDVPVRFDTDFLEYDLSTFEAGEIANIPLIEIKPIASN